MRSLREVVARILALDGVEHGYWRHAGVFCPDVAEEHDNSIEPYDEHGLWQSKQSRT